MLLSIVILARDEAALLPRLLKSIGELPPDVELVLIDTGSTDTTIEIAKMAGARVVELVWPGSFAAARDAGNEAATGEWVVWLDADMVFHLGLIGMLVSRLSGVAPDVDGLEVTIRDTSDGSLTVFPSVRVVRRAVRFAGRVHEEPSAKKVLGTSFAITHDRAESVAAKDAKAVRYEAALRETLRAQRVSPRETDRAFGYLARMLFVQGRYADMRRLLRARPRNDYFDAWMLGQADLVAKRPGDALQRGLEALGKDDGALDPRVFVLIGDALDDLGRLYEALVHYNTAAGIPLSTRRQYPIDLDDCICVPRMNAAGLYARLGLRDKALALCDETLKRIRADSPKRAGIVANRAKIASAVVRAESADGAPDTEPGPTRLTPPT